MEESQNVPSVSEQAVKAEDVIREYSVIHEKSFESDPNASRISRKLSMQVVLVGSEGTTWHLFEHIRGLDRSKAVGNRANLGECWEVYC